MAHRGRGPTVVALMASAALAWAQPAAAWGAQGHRVIATIAWNHLGVAARRAVIALLDGETLASVSTWADDIRGQEPETAPWHFVNIPPGATAYDRRRDCPLAAGRPDDGSRNCVIAQIEAAERRLRGTRGDRTERARALKLLVHFVADVHQPFHAFATARGGTDVPVRVLGSATCGVDGRGVPRECNLHGAWDSSIVSRRHLSDGAFAVRLEAAIRANQWRAGVIAPDAWALEGNRIAVRAAVAPHTDLDEEYFRAFDRTVDERLALAGLRLAAMLNRSLGDGR